MREIETKTMSVYVTTDGRKFEILPEAKMHQVNLDFKMWYTPRSITASNTLDLEVSGDDLFAWMRSNWKDIEGFVNDFNKAGHNVVAPPRFHKPKTGHKA